MPPAMHRIDGSATGSLASTSLTGGIAGRSVDVTMGTSAEPAPGTGADSYSAIAEDYARFSEPAYFAVPARELLALLAVTSSTRLLDVGCGTGALTERAAQVIGDSGLLVAGDRSPGMLAVCRRKARSASLLACALPRLPHPDGTFDVVTASFVLSHLAEPMSALVEMARVLRPGGVLGVSSWVDTAVTTAPGRLWQEQLERHVRPGDLEAISARHVPAEAALADPRALSGVLERAGLAIREVVVREFQVHIATEAFIASRSVSAAAQHVRAHLSPADWQRCLAVAAADLVASFGHQLSFGLRACLACARNVP